jgi:hypothetical protein
MRKLSVHDRLLIAVKRAILSKGVPNTFGLSELEVTYRGPPSGSAGSAVRKWGEEPWEVKWWPSNSTRQRTLDESRTPRGILLSWKKEGRRTVVVVSKMEEVEEMEKKEISDELAEESALFLLGSASWAEAIHSKRVWAKNNPISALEIIHLHTKNAIEWKQSGIARQGADLVLQFCLEGFLPGAGFEISEEVDLSDPRRPLFDRLNAINGYVARGK